MKERNKNKMQFVRTTDPDTAQTLRTLGYTELTEPSSVSYCFINDGKLMFEDGENKDINNKIVYSNVLCI